MYPACGNWSQSAWCALVNCPRDGLKMELCSLEQRGCLSATLHLVLRTGFAEAKANHLLWTLSSGNTWGANFSEADGKALAHATSPWSKSLHALWVSRLDF
jgi:hypothetical protein